MSLIRQDQGKIAFLKLMLKIFGNSTHPTFDYVIHMLERMPMKRRMTAPGSIVKTRNEKVGTPSCLDSGICL